MTTAATPLLADLDHNLTLSAQGASPRTTSPLSRPPTPDPRQPLRPHPPRQTREPSCPISYHTHEQHRLRRKPTAIFVGGEHGHRLDTGAWAHSPDTEVPFAHIGSPPQALSSLLPLPPSTPSPRLPAGSPSLSSSGSTVQSSPTLTPTGAFGSYFIEHVRDGTQSSAAVSGSFGKSGLRRAKRLPHQVQDLWEVHAVVASSEQQRSAAQQAVVQHQHPIEPGAEHRERAAAQAAGREGRLASFGERRDPATKKHATRRRGKGVRFRGVSSESASREGSLRRSQKEETSSYSLSKYRFPSPPIRDTAETFGKFSRDFFLDFTHSFFQDIRRNPLLCITTVSRLPLPSNAMMCADIAVKVHHLISLIHTPLCCSVLRISKHLPRSTVYSTTTSSKLRTCAHLFPLLHTLRLLTLNAGQGNCTMIPRRRAVTSSDPIEPVQENR